MLLAVMLWTLELCETLLKLLTLNPWRRLGPTAYYLECACESQGDLAAL